MHKTIKAFLSERAFEVNGNQGYGDWNGYEVNVFADPFNNQSPVVFHVSCFLDEKGKNQVVSQLQKANIRFLKVTPTRFGFSLGFNGLTIARLVKALPDHLEKILAILKENGAKGKEYCPLCGEILDAENAVLHSGDQGTIRIDRNCSDALKASAEQDEQAFAQMPNNYAKGFLGALLGALVGVTIFVILFFLGFISALSAFVAVLLGAYLYKKLGGKPNKAMVAIVSLTSLVSLVLALFLLYVLAAGGLAIEEELTLEGIDAFRYYMENSPDFSREFTYNLILTVVFSLIGCGYEIYALTRSIRRKKVR